MKKILPLALVVAAIVYFVMTCGESKSGAAARKHCHCGERLAAVAANPQPDSSQPKRLMQAYSEMINCMGGESEWTNLRLGKGNEHSSELLRKMQEQCPQVLEVLQKFGIYGF